MLTLLMTSAYAADCEAVYSSDKLLADIGVMAGALREKQNDLLIGAGAELEAGIVCMAEPMPAPIFASVYRMLGVSKVAGDDLETAALWFRTARELEPTYEWDIQDVEPGSPTWDVYQAAIAFEATAPVALEGKTLSVPAGSRIFIDGRRLTEAAATRDRLHVVQQVGTDGTVRNSWIVKGNRLPLSLLTDEVMTENEVAAVEEEVKKEEKESRRKKDPEVLAGGYTSDDVVMIERERPVAKTPLLVVGGAGLIAAGGVYAASYSARGSFDGATTEEDLAAARTLTNTLVLASGGVLLVGAGVGAWGMLLDGGAGVGMTMEF
jgi:hypothetical protein